MLSTTPAPAGDRAASFYRMIWRWHFYAGLFCIPFVIALALTGSVYLFKPQIEAFIDRDLMRLERTGAPATADAIVAAAIAHVPGSQLAAIVLPEAPDMAARVIVSDAGERTRVYVHPDTLEILKSVGEEDRFGRVVFRMHGELLLGANGGYLVELSACWAIVMILTGLYLWWPRGARGLAGVLYPRLSAGTRTLWRDLHAVTGVWVSALALFLLVTGLPWATVWGGSLKQVREWTGTAAAQQDWFSSSADEHAAHRAADAGAFAPATGAAPLDRVAAQAMALNLAPPVLLSPPTAASPWWTVKSDAGDRTRRADVWLDLATAEPVARTDFADRHVIDRVVGFGIAAHEGRLFGWLNQALGLAAALGLVLLCISSFVMWRKRAPGRLSAGAIGAPPPPPDARAGFGVAAIIVVSGVLLPLLGLCLVALALVERLVLSRVPAARRWLGLKEAAP